jgi:hypothetical protein
MTTYTAYKMTPTQFFYKCSDCKNKHHFHGNCLDYWTNRNETRSSHCENKVWDGKDITIVIDDTTRRVGLNRKQKKKYKEYLEQIKPMLQTL